MSPRPLISGAVGSMARGRDLAMWRPGSALPTHAGPRPGLEEVIVIGLAAARIARAISVDDITAGLRERMNCRADECRAGTIEARVCRFLSDLVHCPVCTGWWASLATSLAWPGERRLRRGVSVAGVQVLITFLDRLVSEQGRAAVHQADEAAQQAVANAS